jgi:uroporphyrinogen-III synthase
MHRKALSQENVRKLATSGPLTQRVFSEVVNSRAFGQRFGIGSVNQLADALTFIGGLGKKSGAVHGHIGRKLFKFLQSQGVIEIHDYAVYIARPTKK